MLLYRGFLNYPVREHTGLFTAINSSNATFQPKSTLFILQDQWRNAIELAGTCLVLAVL